MINVELSEREIDLVLSAHMDAINNKIIMLMDAVKANCHIATAMRLALEIEEHTSYIAKLNELVQALPKQDNGNLTRFQEDFAYASKYTKSVLKTINRGIDNEEANRGK